MKCKECDKSIDEEVKLAVLLSQEHTGFCNSCIIKKAWEMLNYEHHKTRIHKPKKGES